MTLSISKIQTPDELSGRSVPELTELANGIRQFLLDNISVTGGHIGANLGTIELTIALHAAFNSPQTPFLFDTGHQGYTHKLLTGRKDLFPSLNTYGGMSRFLTHHESEHDPIEASHAGTAISVGLGMALARKLQGNDDPVVAVVGDSALVEGISLEGLNHAAVEDTNLVVVVNDNGFAISPGFGAVHEALQSPEGRAEALFESLGCDYIGPVDGHDIGALLTAFETARKSGKLPVVHAKTVKGKGWAPADTHPFRMHFSFPFDIETGAMKSNAAPDRTYPDYLADTLEAAMEADDSIVAITPSTIYATGMAKLFGKYPERCFDPGMEEQHALAMTVGLALNGAKPVIAYQSTFLQRAFDQIVHDVCFMNAPVLILSTRCGFSGYDNPTHHGIYDIAFLRSIPNLTVYYPKDGVELQSMMTACLNDLSGPTMIMMPYGPVDDFGMASSLDPAPAIFEPEVIGKGTDLAVITVGNKFAQAAEVVNRLNANGDIARLVNIRQIKPLPSEALSETLSTCKRIVTVEEAVLDGGMGATVAAHMADRGMTAEIMRLGLPCTFIEPGSNAELMAKYGLDADGIHKAIVNKWPGLA